MLFVFYLSHHILVGLDVNKNMGYLVITDKVYPLEKDKTNLVITNNAYSLEDMIG